MYTNFDAPLLQQPNPEVPDFDPAEFLKAATSTSTRGGDEDRPIQSSNLSFDEMLQRAMELEMGAPQ